MLLTFVAMPVASHVQNASAKASEDLPTSLCAGVRRGARRESSSWRRRLRRCKQRQARAAAMPLAWLLV